MHVPIPRVLDIRVDCEQRIDEVLSALASRGGSVEQTREWTLQAHEPDDVLGSVFVIKSAPSKENDGVLLGHKEALHTAIDDRLDGVVLTEEGKDGIALCSVQQGCRQYEGQPRSLLQEHVAVGDEEGPQVRLAGEVGEAGFPRRVLPLKNGVNSRPIVRRPTLKPNIRRVPNQRIEFGGCRDGAVGGRQVEAGGIIGPQIEEVPMDDAADMRSLLWSPRGKDRVR